MTFLLILAFGVIAGMIIQKSAMEKKRPELTVYDENSPIKIQTQGKKVFIEGPVESVVVNNKKMIEYKSEKH